MSGSVTADLYQVLAARGLVAQCTDEAIHDRLAEPVTCYIGFDPTADSLHVGSLVPVMGLAWLQRCGHRPLALVGGATAMIGDPSGKSSARQMLDSEAIAANSAAIQQQLSGFLDFGDGPTGAEMVNNADWLGDKKWIDVLREVGPHISVNRMVTMESVRQRMDGSGISFLEFNYMVLQAYDFLHLHRSHGCTLQMGGQDQWGNIVMGIELGRRLADASLAGLTMPLVTKSDGTKFGKSEQGNIWLAKERTPVYEFYQFWRNVADADVGRFLGYFTFLSDDEVQRLAALEGQELNQSKEVLAFEVTQLVHGKAAAEQAQADARKAFSGAQDVTGDSIPHSAMTGAELEQGIGILDLGVRASLWKSKGEGRRLVQGGGVRIHDDKIDDPTTQVTSAHITDGYVLLRAGKKRMHRFDVSA